SSTEVRQDGSRKLILPAADAATNGATSCPHRGGGVRVVLAPAWERSTVPCRACQGVRVNAVDWCRKRWPHRVSGVCSNVDMLQVVAAILQRDGKILVGQRTPLQSHPLKWEFPGGKVITRYRYTYPGKDPIELIFFRVRRFSGEPRNLIFHDLHWQPNFQLAEL